MNSSEIETFTDELLIAFPAFKSVSERHSPDFERTKCSWGLAWRDLGINECRDVLELMTTEGNIRLEDFQQPGPFIRKLVLSARNKGKSSEEDRALSSLNRTARKDYVGSPQARALATAIEMRTKGASQAQVVAAIAEQIPSRPIYDQPRYNCHACSDRGLVLVWRMDYAEMVHHGKLKIEQLHHGHTYNVACSCEKGQLLNRPKEDRFRMPIYSSSEFCRVIGMELSDDHEELRIWLQRKSKPVEWVA